MLAGAVAFSAVLRQGRLIALPLGFDNTSWEIQGISLHFAKWFHSKNNLARALAQRPSLLVLMNLSVLTNAATRTCWRV